jgi:starvation-inducible DNA-binding protein
VEAATSQELIDQLKVLLSNTVTVYHQAHGFHWNVEGDDFVPYHELFNKIYDDLYESIDPTAENIRKLQGEAPYTLDEFMALRTITESIPGETPESMGTALLSKLEELIGSLKMTFAIANGANEQGVANFVADRIDTFQKWAWQLRASVVEGAESMDKEEGDTDLPEAVNASAVEEDCGCNDTEEACADCVGDCADCIEEAKKAKKKVEKTADSFAFRDGRPIEWTTDLDQNFLNGINEKFSDIYDLANQTTQMGSRISMQVQSYAAYLKGVSLDEQNLLDRTLGKPTLPEGSGKEDNDPTPMAYEIQLSLMDLDVLSPI